MKILEKVYYKISILFFRYIILPFYHHIYLPPKVNKMREKRQITFLFVLQDLKQWKTESLYLSMLKHPRFNPILGIASNKEVIGKEKDLVDYCHQKNYNYILLESNKTLIQQANPDIIAYQKPYKELIHEAHYVSKNRKALFVMIPYAMNSVIMDWAINQWGYLLCWQLYSENEMCCEDRRKLSWIKGKNYVITGFPIMDEFLSDKTCFMDPWPKDRSLKRIIYAPHHTIGDMHYEGISYSTFLENADFMLQMREKYKNKVYFIFKPHPLLHRKLEMYWGEEKTESYYNKWRYSENSHIEEGEYIGLFKYSDAMIHDCSSFTIEYLYTGNPVMYLTKEENHEENLNRMAKEAFRLHEKGNNHIEIEQFIERIISGINIHRDEMIKFRKERLTPPHGKKASDNIINAILGIEDYSI